MTEKVLRCDDDKHAHKQTHSCYGDCYKSCSLNSGSLILSKPQTYALGFLLAVLQPSQRFVRLCKWSLPQITINKDEEPQNKTKEKKKKRRRNVRWSLKPVTKWIIFLQSALTCFVSHLKTYTKWEFFYLYAALNFQMPPNFCRGLVSAPVCFTLPH